MSAKHCQAHLGTRAGVKRPRIPAFFCTCANPAPRSRSRKTAVTDVSTARRIAEGRQFFHFWHLKKSVPLVIDRPLIFSLPRQISGLRGHNSLAGACRLTGKAGRFGPVAGSPGWLYRSSFHLGHQAQHRCPSDKPPWTPLSLREVAAAQRNGICVLNYDARRKALRVGLCPHTMGRNQPTRRGHTLGSFASSHKAWPPVFLFPRSYDRRAMPLFSSPPTALTYTPRRS